ncbi:MAG: class F sortase, partial [Streptomyces sp.]|nr:class F sortase [Streptomyces sp.]
RAELRLITCGGTFDRATRSYTANVIVSAYLTATGL